MQKKKWVVGVTAASLAAVVAIGATLAYFTSQTQSITNEFHVATGTDGITGELKEPAWDGIEFGETEAQDPSDSTLGINQAKHILPGDTIPKNPTLKNTTQASATNTNGDDLSAYVAIKAVFPDNFTDYASVTIDSTKWELIDGETGTGSAVYLWVSDGNPAALAADDATDPLFSNVQIKSDVDSNTLKDFDIQLQGALIQSKNLTDSNTIQQQLIDTLTSDSAE